MHYSGLVTCHRDTWRRQFQNREAPAAVADQQQLVELAVKSCDNDDDGVQTQAGKKISRETLPRVSA